MGAGIMRNKSQCKNNSVIKVFHKCTKLGNYKYEIIFN